MTAIDYDGLVEQLNGVANYFQEVGCSSTIPAEAATAIQTLRAEVERLTKLCQPEWFYDAENMETCEYSVSDVIDRFDLNPGGHVIEIGRAAPLPNIWAAVHCRTDEEMDALETDDREVITEFASEDEARAFLAKQEPSQ